MLNRGVEWKRIGHNPIADLKPLRHDKLAKSRRALTAEEVQRLFDASPEQLRPVWWTLACTGIRRNELVELRWDDVDFEARTIVIRADRSKNHKAREIPLDDRVYAMLAVLRDGRNIGNRSLARRQSRRLRRPGTFRRNMSSSPRRILHCETTCLAGSTRFASGRGSTTLTRAAPLTFTPSAVHSRPYPSTVGRTQSRSKRSLAIARWR